MGAGFSWRLCAAAALVLALSGCTAGAARGGPGSPGAPASSSGPVPTASVAAPGCSTGTAAAPRLPAGLVRLSPVPGSPFGVAVTASGRWSFVSLLPGGRGGGGLGVFAGTGSAGPRLVRKLAVPGGGGLGVRLTPDGRYLLVADGSGAAVVSVPAAEQGSRNAVLGSLASGSAGRAGFGAIEVTVSRDGGFAFVSLEGSGKIAVFDLRRALASHFHAAGFVGDVPAGIAPVGLAVTPDGAWLYSTSELASLRALRRAGPRAPGSRGGVLGGQGTLSVISVHKAETDPARAIVSTVTAGCGPVRVVASADGRVVWVTARESDMLLGFSASRLRGDPRHALIARVEVGEAPVGLALVDGGQRIVVADSNRFGRPGAGSSLAVVDAGAALAGRPALAGYLPAGGFPREMALEPDGRTLLVTNFVSQQIETVNVTKLP